MTEIEGEIIQSFINIPFNQNTPIDHFFLINSEQKQIIFNISSSSQKNFSFSDILLKESPKDLSITQEMASNYMKDLQQGYNNAIILITDQDTNDMINDLSYLIEHSLYEQSNGVSNISLIDTVCSSYIIFNEKCYDSLTGSSVDIKEIEETKEAAIEGLSFHRITNAIEGNDFVKKVTENYCKRNNMKQTSLGIKIMCTFDTCDTEKNHSKIHISQLNILVIPFNKQSLVRYKDNNTVKGTEEIPLQHLIGLVNPSSYNEEEMVQGLPFILKDFIGGQIKTSIIASVNEIMTLTKEEAHCFFILLSNAMVIKNFPMSNHNGPFNLLNFKSLYKDMINNRKNLMTNSNHNLITHIKELINHQNTMNNTLKRFPFISSDILNSINKYKEDCQIYYNTNCDEISKLKKALEETLTASSQFNLELKNQKESNGKPDQQSLKTIQVFSERIQQILSLLKTQLPNLNGSKNNDSNIHLSELEAYSNLVTFYTLKEANTFLSEEESERFKELIYRIIVLNDEIYSGLLKGKVLETYELVEKSEYKEMIKQLNEIKNTEQQNLDTSQEINNYQQKMTSLNKEIQSLNAKMLESKRTHSSFNCAMTKSFKETTIEYKGRKIDNLPQYKEIECSHDHDFKNLQENPSTSFSFFPKRKSLRSSNSSMKVHMKNSVMPRNNIRVNVHVSQERVLSKERSIIKQRELLKEQKAKLKEKQKEIERQKEVAKSKVINREEHYNQPNDNNYETTTIAKSGTCPYFKSIAPKNSKSTSKTKPNSNTQSANSIKILKNEKSNNNISVPKENDQIYAKLFEEQENEIAQLKLLNEYISKQKDMTISSLNNQLTNCKLKVSDLESHVKDLQYDKAKLMRDNIAIKTEQKHKTISPARQTATSFNDSAKKKPQHLSLINQSPKNSNDKSIELYSNCDSANKDKTFNRKPKDRDISYITNTCNQVDSITRSPRGYQRSSVLNDSTLKLLDEIKTDNTRLVNEITVLQSKNLKLASDIQQLSHHDKPNSDEVVNYKKIKKKLNTVLSSDIPKKYQ